MVHKIESPIVKCNVVFEHDSKPYIPEKHSSHITNRYHYKRGLMCQFMCVPVTDMTRYELIEFIGMLDELHESALVRAGLA